MRFGVSGRLRRGLLRGAAIVVVGGLAAGCSSDVARFQDSILTGSSRPHQAAAPVSQPYPGDYANLDNTPTGSVNRGALRSMNVFNRNSRVPKPTQDVGMMAAAAPAGQMRNGQPQYAQPQFNQNQYPQAPATGVASAPVARGAALAPVASAGLDTMPTGTVAPAAQQRATAPAGGWNGSGGTRVTMRQGETLYNLSRRYGVPVNAIMSANGLSDANSVAVGQQIVIPAYTYSTEAPVSAPDNNPRVAVAPSTSGSGSPSDRAPQPAPGERIAVLPQQPKPQQERKGEEVATAPSAGTQTPPAGRSYTVVAGDTLNGIARKTGVATETLKTANGLNSGLIRIGQTLTIPETGALPVQRASASAGNLDPVRTGTVAPAAPQKETVAAYTPPSGTANAIEEASRQTAAVTPDSTGIERMRWPVRGRVIAPFGANVGGKANDGIDIAVPEGTPVKAAENGVVIFAGAGLKDFGNTVLVRHEDGLVTVYGHTGDIKVSRGDKVRRGQEIALSGMSGSAETPKLHFEVRKDSAPVNPISHLE